MAIDQLALYNIAIASVGERTLDSIAEQRQIRRELDSVWERGSSTVGVRQYFLEQGLWNFAMRESSSTASSTGTFNFLQRHAKPSDLVRLSAISLDQNFSTPLNRYEYQSSSIWTDDATIYLRYVSNSSTAGLNYDLWPMSFVQWAGHWLGSQIAPYVFGGGLAAAERTQRNISEREGATKKITTLVALANRLLMDAKIKDAQDEPSRFPPSGSWVQARHGGSRRDRGNRGSLTG